MILGLCIAVSVGFAFAWCVVEGKRHSVCIHDILGAIFTHNDGI